MAKFDWDNDNQQYVHTVTGKGPDYSINIPSCKEKPLLGDIKLDVSFKEANLKSSSTTNVTIQENTSFYPHRMQVSYGGTNNNLVITNSVPGMLVNNNTSYIRNFTFGAPSWYQFNINSVTMIPFGTSTYDCKSSERSIYFYICCYHYDNTFYWRRNHLSGSFVIYTGGSVWSEYEGGEVKWKYRQTKDGTVNTIGPASVWVNEPEDVLEIEVYIY